jgi:hypothetical protein
LGETLLISPDYRGTSLETCWRTNSFDRASWVCRNRTRTASEQLGVQVFERLGCAEALLGDYVMDRQGRTHDLIVMSYDVTGLTE